MFEGHDRIIFEVVSEGRLVDPRPLEQACREQRRCGRSLADLLVDGGLLERVALLRAVAAHLGADHADTVPATLPVAAVALIDPRLARTHGVVPLQADATAITLLAVDPLNHRLVGDLTFALGREVRLAIADPARVAGLVRQHYGDGRESAAAGVLPTGTAAPAADGDLSAADIEQLAGQSPVIRFVNGVLSQAIRDRASDIHFEPFDREFKIRCRVDGVLHEMAPPSKVPALAAISRLKVLASLDIAERRLPQDGRIKLNVAGRAVDLRVSTLPTQFGESVVLRVLDRAAVRLEIAELGLPAEMERAVRGVIRRPHGIFMVTGPTGSGKTTTLYSCLRALNTAEAKILTVEDPVEYEIDGLMQVGVNPAAGLTFGRALRAFLRQDPDIVMVGEIRDLETAQIAIQASLTGHLVLSTLHTNDAPGALSRLADLGVEPFLLASTVEAVLAQRLVRRLCADCRSGYAPTARLLRRLGADPAQVGDRTFHRARGCGACHGTGYRGRVALFELLSMNDDLRELVAAGAAPVLFRRRAAALGLNSLREAGLRAVLAGATTADEVLKYT